MTEKPAGTAQTREDDAVSTFDIEQLLREAADEMRAENQNGWPVVCDMAAFEIASLRSKLEEAEGAHGSALVATPPAETVVEALLSNITDVVAEAEVDFPAGREAGARVSFDEDAVRGFIRAALAAKDGRS